MACCVKIEPRFVIQSEGPFYETSEPGGYGQRTWWWSPANAEQDFGEPDFETIRIRHEYADAFTTMEHPCLVDYPDELTINGGEHAIHEGEESFSLRTEFLDSEPCEADDDSGSLYGESCRIFWKLTVCSPITIKAAILGRVSSNGQDRPTGALTLPYQAFDRCTVSISRRTEAYGGCDETTEEDSGYTILACGHEMTGGDSCEMDNRSDCGTAMLCEGVYYLAIDMGTMDSHEHVGAYWEVELTFACGADSLDCDAEVELETYLPCDPEEYEPCTPPEDPSDPQPGECGGGQVQPSGECYCGECMANGIELEISGYSDSACEVIAGTLLDSTASSLNGTYVLTPVSSNVFEINLGSSLDCDDSGIVVSTVTYPGINVLCVTFVYKITVTLSCVLEADEPRWSAAIVFSRQSRIREFIDPCGEWIGSCDDSGLSGACLNTEFFTETDHNKGCDGNVTYRNEGNVEYGMPEAFDCNCYPVDGYAFAVVRPLASEGCPEE